MIIINIIITITFSLLVLPLLLRFITYYYDYY